MQGNTPHVIYGKPFAHISLPDWESKILQNHQTNDTRRSDGFNLRCESRKLRNEKKIETDWNTHRSNNHLDERLTETETWKEHLEFWFDNTKKELNELRCEKSLTEMKLDSLDNPLTVIEECIAIRDNRRRTELTNDDVEEELKKELCIVQQMRKLLTEHCQIAWEKINALEQLLVKLNIDIYSKQEASSVDDAQLKLNRNCAEITLKPDPLGIIKRSLTHNSWIQQLEILRQVVEDELVHSRKIRENLFAIRERAKNDMLEQHDLVEFYLRKRIFLTNKMKNEINWHQMKMAEEMSKVAEEIKALEYAIQDILDPTRLVETRLENRFLRPLSEITSDEPENKLKEELIQLRQTKKELLDKITVAKSIYNALEDQKVLIDRDLEDKTHTLDVDIKCLDTRSRLRADILLAPRNVSL